MAKSRHSIITSRRNVLAGVAAATVAGSLPVIGKAADPHRVWFERAQSMETHAPNIVDDDQRARAIDELIDLQWEIVETPATTREGALVQLQQLEILNLAGGELPSEQTATALRNIINTLGGA